MKNLFESIVRELMTYVIISNAKIVTRELSYLMILSYRCAQAPCPRTLIFMLRLQLTNTVSKELLRITI